MSKAGYVYIMSNQRNGTLYIGVTSNLIQRVYQHRNSLIEGFTKQHALHHLVYYECLDDTKDAIAREKQLKAWRRSWKIDLINADNVHWNDLYDDICGKMDPESSSG